MDDSQFDQPQALPMAAKLLAALRVLRRPRVLKALLSMSAIGYLNDTGWVRSLEAGGPMDKLGQPIPWMTLPFVDFIGPRLDRSMTVFEFGSGSSTLYFAQRVSSVFSVEHDRAWFDHVQGIAPSNVEVKLVELEYDGAYCRTATATGRTFDLIVVDGRDRVRCALESVASLSARGCIVLDDAERPIHAAVDMQLRAQGFKLLEFWGVAPGLAYRKCTSLFYRPGNCLDL